MGKNKGAAPQTFEQLYVNRRNACQFIMKTHVDAKIPMIPDMAAGNSGITPGELITEARLQHWKAVKVDIHGMVHIGWEPRGE